MGGLAPVGWGCFRATDPPDGRLTGLLEMAERKHPRAFRLARCTGAERALCILKHPPGPTSAPAPAPSATLRAVRIPWFWGRLCH